MLSIQRSRLLVLVLVLFTFLQAQNLDLKQFKDAKPRAIGPAGMSGRVTAIAIQPDNPLQIYIGAASGGVWRSVDGGVKWKPIFDEQAIQSVGALALDPHNPDIIWVGTGEGNPRNSMSSGNGIFKSIDGGKSWQKMGLENTFIIHRIIPDPTNSNIVFVAAMGTAWGTNKERGVYKTTDGGKSWKKVLYVNDKTGAAELVMDPKNPNKLIAGMWEYRRWPWFFKSGGPGSGMYITYDGGKNWIKRTDKDGLPKGELGRMGLAIAPSDPKTIYALIEAKKNALYKSTDGGFKWKKIADKNIGGRPFYYAEIYVDPENKNRVYNVHTTVTVSDDGGKTFSTLVPWTTVHPDHHAFFIDKNNPNYIIDGNDGGLAISYDRGATWRYIENLPLAQFYHVNVDMEIPYNIYGGMQDNGSWVGPAYTWRNNGIRNLDWQELSFGDGFDVVPDPNNTRFGYSMSQQGNVMRYDRQTGNSVFIKPVHPENTPLRFHWNAAIAISPTDKNTLYFASQFLHKSQDNGLSWEIISPDLTTNDPEKQNQNESGGLTYDATGAENHTTIISIAPSALDEKIIWVGTDDGNVQLTTDGGTTWKNMVSNIPDVPKNAWVAQITASRYNKNEAFVVINNYRQNDWKPYLYHTTNLGKSWSRLINEKDVSGHMLSFVQDIKEPNLMFAGAENGLWFSINAGKKWQKWDVEYPSAATRDMVIHPREGDLVIATFGRAAFVFDDINWLREMARSKGKVLDKALHLLPVPDAYLAAYQRPAGPRFVAHNDYDGTNRPYGAMITYFNKPDTSTNKTELKEGQKSAKGDSIKVEIYSESGEKVRTLWRKTKSGLNRFNWYLDHKGVRYPWSKKGKNSHYEPSGGSVLPGKYKLKMTFADYVDSTTVHVLTDPRLNSTPDLFTTKRRYIEKLNKRAQKATAMVDRINEAKDIVKGINSRLEYMDKTMADSIRNEGKVLTDSLDKVYHMINSKKKKGIYSDKTTLSYFISKARGYIVWTGKVAEQMADFSIKKADNRLQEVETSYNLIFNAQWQSYRKLVETSTISFFNKKE